MKLLSKIRTRLYKPLAVCTLSSLMVLPLLTGCEDFLDTESTHFSNNNLDNPSDTLFSVIGVLYKLQSLSDRTILLGELRGDLVELTHSAAADLREIAQFQVGDDNEYNSPRDYYAVINNCNYFLSKVDTALKNNRNEYVFRKEYAVIKAYRAWTYLQLVLNYGEVPLVIKPIMTKEDADKTYPKFGIVDVCNYFIDDLQGVADVEYPSYGIIRNTDSRFFYIPIHLLLGELNLWAGHYKESAWQYYTFLNTRNGTYSLSGVRANAVSWFRNDLKWMSIQDSWSTTAFESEVYSSNAELITMYPGDSIPSENQYSRLRSLFNPSADNDYTVSIQPSQQLIELSAAQTYCHFTQDANIVYAPKGINDYRTGDLRLGSAWRMSYAFVDGKSQFIRSINKFTSRNVHLYRLSMVYLRMAEALNRAGYPHFAFQILKTGINNGVIEQKVMPNYPESASWLGLFNFPNTLYELRTPAEAISENTIGIHSHGSGWSEYNTFYSMPEDSTLDGPALLEYQKEKVEDLIMDECALELAFEGMRFYDLMRVALRRNQPTYLSDRIYHRGGGTSSTNIGVDLTDTKNWFLHWNGQLGLGLSNE